MKLRPGDFFTTFVKSQVLLDGVLDLTNVLRSGLLVVSQEKGLPNEQGNL